MPLARRAQRPVVGILAASILGASLAVTTEAAPPRAQQLLAAMPLYFVENCGQADSRIAYSVTRGGYRVLFSTEGIAYTFDGPRETAETDGTKKTPPPPAERWVLRVSFHGANPAVRIAPGKQARAAFHFFRGPREAWTTDVGSFESIVYENLWPGIDLVYSGEKGELKATFIVRPGADPEKIRVAYTGAEEVEVTRGGGLRISTPSGGIEEGAPVTFQESGSARQAVEASYVVREGPSGAWTCGFVVGAYDPSKTLAIDPPILTYSGFIGGSYEDYGRSIAVDSSGCAYVTGNTDSLETTFPETGGPDLTANGSMDAFVAKVAADGASLIYCGYIGGSGYNWGYGIAVDSSGCAYVTGSTDSTEGTFPETGGPDLTFNDTEFQYDAFVTKVAANGASLTYCGYIGGASDDRGQGIAVDSSGCAYVTGYTASTEATFPETGGPDLTYNSSTDAFVAKVAANGASLAYCGYIGGSGLDNGAGIAVDSSGCAYVTGDAESTESDFPVTDGPDLTFNGANFLNDTFVAKVASDGASLTYCGYIGGSGYDYGYGIAVDSSGCAYVTGRTTSTQPTFPVSGGPDLTHNGGSNDAFVTKITTLPDGGITVSSANGSTTGASSAATLSWQHTIGSASNRILIVGVAIGGSTSPTVSSVTWNGTALTQVTSGSVNGTNCRAEMWYLLNPGTGVGKTITVTLSGSARFTAGAVVFAGVHQTTPFDTFSSATGNSTAPSVAATSAATDVVIDVLAAAGTPTATAGAGQTSEWTQVTSGGTNVRGAGSIEVGAASVTMSYTLSASGRWAIGAVSLNPSYTTAVELASFDASQTTGGGMELVWRTGLEADNLGFHLWRERGAERVRITPSLIAGSALLFGDALPRDAGHAYRFFDPDGTPSDRYVLEDVDLQGARTLSHPVRGSARHAVESRGQAAGPRQALESSPTFSRRTRTMTAHPESHRLGARRTARSSANALSPLSTQWALAASPASLKILVCDEGWYRLTGAELVAAGLDPAVDPRRLQLFADGREIPLRVTGRGGRRLDPRDAVEFYGMGLDTLSTDTRVYWLTAGSAWGARIDRLAAGRPPMTAPPSFPFSVEHRLRSTYFASLRNSDAGNFFGEIITAEPVEVLLDVPHPDRTTTGGDATLRVTLQGVTKVSHSVSVLFNGIEAGSIQFEGQELRTEEFQLAADTLLAGVNSVIIASSGGETDMSLLDSIELAYRHTWDADGDELRCVLPAGTRTTIRGFSTPELRVIDVTDPDRPCELRPTVRKDGASYAVVVAASIRGARELYAFADTRAMQPAGIVRNRPSRRHEGLAGAWIAMIAHESLLPELAPLEALRRSQGYTVAAIDVADLYDEFTFGAKSPDALKKFLTTVPTAPRSALLAGDASVDPRDFLGRGDFDLVPTRLLDTSYLETASDDWFGDFDGDGIPEVPIGRLPARTPEEARTIVAKIVGYESGGDGAWARDVLLVADRNEGFDFEAATRDLASLVPSDLAVREVFLGQGDPAAARDELLAGLAAGGLFVNYVGHGSVEIWSRGVLTSRDVRVLANGPRLPFVAIMDCLNGFFHDVNSESLAEAFLQAEDGGAVAVWASSGLTDPTGQVELDRALLRALFDGRGRTIGEAVREAKAATGSDDIRKSWILLGDPATRLR